MADRFDLVNLGKSITTTTGGTSANVNIDANTLFVDGVNNRVGIGTSSPAGGLNVAGNRLLLGPSSELYALQVGFNQTRVSAGQAYYIGASDAASPDLVLSNAAGLERVRVDASGRVTRPSQPYFLASAGFGNSSRFFSTGGEFIGNVMTVHHNVGGHYNNANGRFTAPVTGRYLISFQYSAETGNLGDISVFKNGSAQTIMSSVTVIRPSTFSWTNGAQCYVAELNANDFISLGITAYTNNAGASFCMFSAMLIG